MSRVQHYTIVMIFIFSSSCISGEDDRYVSVQLDQKIRIELPKGWITPNSALEQLESKHELEMEGVNILMHPHNEAKIIYYIIYEPSLENSALKHTSNNFLKEYNHNAKQTMEKSAGEMNVKLLEWADPAHTSVINEYAALSYSYLRTTHNRKYNTRVENYIYHFSDRQLYISYEYNDRKKHKYIPILKNILNSLSLSSDNDLEKYSAVGFIYGLQIKADACGKKYPELKSISESVMTLTYPMGSKFVYNLEQWFLNNHGRDYLEQKKMDISRTFRKTEGQERDKLSLKHCTQWLKGWVENGLPDKLKYISFD